MTTFSSNISTLIKDIKS